MQRVLTHLYQWSLPEKIILSAAVWMCLALAIPSRIASFDFRHFIDSEGMTISFSHSAPPMAALEDEHLPVVTTVVSQPTTVQAPAQVPASVVAVAAISHVSASVIPQIRAAKRARLLARRSSFARRIAFLKGLVRAIPAQAQVPLKDPSTQARQLAVYTLQKRKNQTGPTIRDRVDAPLTAPSVPRGLPRGEDAAPVVIKEDHISANRTPSFEVTAPTDKVATSGAGNPAGALFTSGPGVAGAPASPANSGFTWKAPAARSAVNNPIQPSSNVAQNGSYAPVQPSVPAKNNNERKIPMTDQGLAQSVASNFSNQSRVLQSASQGRLMTNDAASLVNPDQDTLTEQQARSLVAAQPAPTPAPSNPALDIYKISGQVQLSGGLALTDSSELTIQWKTGNQTRDAKVDYSAGAFAVAVPILPGGKIIGLLKDETGHLIGRGEVDLNDAELLPNQTEIIDIELNIEAQQSLVRGQVLSAYSVGPLVIPVKGAEVFGPSSSRDVADGKGAYRLSQLNGDSTMILDTYASEHWGSRVIAAGSSRPKIILFSDSMVQSFLDIVGQGGNNADYGIVWGEVNHKGTPVSGVRVAISTTDAMGPIYFNELRIPDKSLQATSGNGLYAFIKVKPGLHVVSAEYNSRELPSAVTSVSASMVSYNKILFTSLNLAGRIVDPLAQIAVNGQVSVVGSSKTVPATTEGFNVRVPSSDPLVFVEANAGENYLVSRAAVPRREAADLAIPVYRRDWLKQQLQAADLKYDSNKGVLVGYVTGPAFRVRLDDADFQAKLAESDADSNAIYFNADGQADASVVEGSADGGGFIVPNLLPGVHTLVISSSDGEITASRLFVSEAGVVNVLTMPLRP